MPLIWTKKNFRTFGKEWWMCSCVSLSRENIFFAYLVWSGLNHIFHWYAQSIIFNRWLLSAEAEVFTQFTMLNKEVSSAKSLTLEVNPSGRSFI